MVKKQAIGIDLGTSNSCVAVFQHGKLEIIANDKADRTIPSFVAFRDTERLIGHDAKRWVTSNITNTIYDIKRLMGRNIDDEAVQANMKFWPFKVVGEGLRPMLEVEYMRETKRFTPEECSAMILTKMKDIAEDHLGSEVKHAVVSVPAQFNDSQRQATIDACAIAGLNVLKIISAPNAAALAYGHDKKFHANEFNILIFDFGGGKVDVSILTTEEDVFEVKSTAGDTHLGGEDLDSRMVDHFVKEFKAKHNMDIRANKKTMRRLRTNCERAKRAISNSFVAKIEIESLFEEIDFYTSITRARFEELCSDLFQKALALVEKAIADAKMDFSSINDIVLVGASSRIPMIQKMLQDLFNGKKLNMTLNPEETVAYGAALQAAFLTGVASEVSDLLILDVAPLSLRTETAGEGMVNLMKRNFTIPTIQTRTITTCNDGQTTINIQVYEVEEDTTKDNHLLGKFELTGIPHGPKIDTRIKVRFDIDNNGILSVSALEESTSKRITVAAIKGGLSNREIERMVKDAEKFKEVDKKQKERVFARQRLENYCLNVKNNIEDKVVVDMISKDEKKKITEKCDETLRFLDDFPQAYVQVFQNKQIEVEGLCNPIISKLNRSFYNETSKVNNIYKTFVFKQRVRGMFLLHF